MEYFPSLCLAKGVLFVYLDFVVLFSDNDHGGLISPDWLEFLSLLPQPPKCGDYRGVLLHLLWLL